MNHADHVKLIRPGIVTPGGAWTDLGAGTGAFTLALREILGPEAKIIAVDKDEAALRVLDREYRKRFGEADGLQTLEADFSKPVELPAFDGVLMANSLHFFRDKVAILEHVRSMLRPGGTLLLVEYNVEKGNAWVPFPLAFPTFVELARRAGFVEPKLLATHPSNFLREFYSAAAQAP